METGNSFITIENGQLSVYPLDEMKIWNIGRISKESTPDIILHSYTASRKHGVIQNVNGEWFYYDFNGKNGTVYNGKHIKNKFPIPLKDGDTFVFGGGENESIGAKTIWGRFSKKNFPGEWKLLDTEGMEVLEFSEGEESEILDVPSIGTVIEGERGIAIYMGNITYLYGEIKLQEKRI